MDEFVFGTIIDVILFLVVCSFTLSRDSCNYHRYDDIVLVWITTGIIMGLGTVNYIFSYCRGD